ncbi:murein peptide amidase A [Erwinia tracheiphila PSU-1]|nr:murein peptide amidase A [Erwinia tracheiphila PSU-1]
MALSCAMRTLKDEHRRRHVVLAMNPDGCSSACGRMFVVWI